MHVKIGNPGSLGLSLAAALIHPACALQTIDQIIDEHGVTYSPSSSSSADSASSGPDTTTGDYSGTADGSGEADTSGPFESSASSSTGELSGGGSSGEETDTTENIAPFCGDGVVQADETCDDGNSVADDGCQECARDSVIFISSEVYQGFSLGGIYGAGQRCRSLAAKAGLPRSETFQAWLSVSTKAVADRLKHSRGRYVLVNGLTVAHNWDALISGSLVRQINIDENLNYQDTRVWTGTKSDGSPAVGSEFCGDWDEPSALLHHGGEGRNAEIDGGWTFYAQGLCGAENRIYCVEQ